MRTASADSSSAGANPTFTTIDRVYMLEAVTGASTVTTLTQYAYSGVYDSGFTSGLPTTATRTSKNHNIGSKFINADLIIECIIPEQNYVVGEQLSHKSIGTNDAASKFLAMSITPTTLALTTGSSVAFMILNATTGVSSTFTSANWKYKFVAQRTW